MNKIIQINKNKLIIILAILLLAAIFFLWQFYVITIYGISVISEKSEGLTISCFPKYSHVKLSNFGPQMSIVLGSQLVFSIPKENMPQTLEIQVNTITLKPEHSTIGTITLTPDQRLMEYEEEQGQFITFIELPMTINTKTWRDFSIDLELDIGDKLYSAKFKYQMTHYKNTGLYFWDSLFAQHKLFLKERKRSVH
ncbi:MAG: hypothetical protein PHD57_07855 [Desulfobacterales bacterium]|nr:hypothetical protein [Desulfobacterales bacterium]MDD3082739.1 hypothetical protein [Desulfobacterales bacterium]MDD3951138.1 hypothetical protein [Desulfobacterales bacterium]